MSSKRYLICISIDLFILTTIAMNISSDLYNKYCIKPLTLKVSPNSIDGLWKLETGGIIFISDNYYSFVTELHENGFPEIGDDYPLGLTVHIRNKTQSAKKQKQYIFEDYIYGIKDPSKDIYYLNGFNQIWFGCPQQICIDAGIDAITHDNSRNIIVFRGKYYWTLGDTSNHEISAAKLISKDFGDIPSHLDAVSTIFKRNETYFFKNNYIWIHSDNTNVSVSKIKIVNIFQNGPNSINAAIYISVSPNQTYIYLFRNSQYWCYDMSDGTSPPYLLRKGYPIFVKALHKLFPTDINSGFEDLRTKNVVFFIRWKYISFPVNLLTEKHVIKDIDIQRQYSFKLFGCDSNDYKKWGFNSFDSFLENYGKRSENFQVFPIQTTPYNTVDSRYSQVGYSESPDIVNATGNSITTETITEPNLLESTATENESKSDDNSSDLPFYVLLIVIVLICLALVLLILIGLFRKRQINFTKTEDTSRVIEETDPSEEKHFDLSESTISDMPSREVKSIVIDSNELKPVKSSVFKWNSTKVSENKNKTKVNKIKEKEAKLRVLVPKQDNKHVKAIRYETNIRSP